MQACAQVAFLPSCSLVAGTPANSVQNHQVSGSRYAAVAPSKHQLDCSWSLRGITLLDRSKVTSSPAQSRRNFIRAATGESATTSSSVKAPVLPGIGSVPKDRVKHITTVEEFDEALRLAKNKLVVVEYAATHSANSRKIYPAMVELSKSCQDVVFLLVLGDETEGTKELCDRAGVETVPHFVFYRNQEKIHEEKGVSADTLEGDVLYYGDINAPIHQVKTKQDFDILLKEHASDSKLVVIDIGLKSCGPCVKVYPTVVKLAKKLSDSTIFARMHGDENEDCMDLLRSMDVVEVPTFLFIRDGKPLGRYRAGWYSTPMFSSEPVLIFRQDRARDTYAKNLMFTLIVVQQT
ncbi:hypothetical protein AXG93_1976s1300 [Marchantia polymorpha subsp. ruderalis]|uniref:Thioredoxin domain-containing protein n=1 Tax=Marchantia polymorpha subsp. ruderalis TaxID=1480154 RepID=A0A176VDH3_MARPO|nr:hypothetical protein AXG93_1976s1300 [Marchantia polymorpha subsp. ruderalis]